jgi:hypothetical protein
MIMIRSSKLEPLQVREVESSHGVLVEQSMWGSCVEVPVIPPKSIPEHSMSTS